jgi:hypothetical protein
MDVWVVATDAGSNGPTVLNVYGSLDEALEAEGIPAELAAADESSANGADSIHEFRTVDGSRRVFVWHM